MFLGHEARQTRVKKMIIMCIFNPTKRSNGNFPSAGICAVVLYASTSMNKETISG
jgi:hypothetical protein